MQKNCKNFANTLWIAIFFSKWYICVMSNVMIGAISSGKKACLTREFRKLYKPSKKSMARKQKIAIALNKCNIKRK